ncbi:hypothetical protein [Winogradskyella sp.]|uniref:hypothetical protein n=1 Tax=Winogradskyella sp. TaxID=1883156 RepID=UPI003AB58A21
MLKKIIILVLFINFYNCEDLIEVEDISNESVTILAPVDNSALDTTTVSFSWDSLEYAESYQLQIAKPNFDYAQEIILDTIIRATNFTKTLLSNSYQWRVRAKNFGYETTYTMRNLTIED